MLIDYTETNIEEALDDLVASGEVVKTAHGYFTTFHEAHFPATDPTQSRAILALILAFDLNPGDFISIGFYSDGAEVRVNRVE